MKTSISNSIHDQVTLSNREMKDLAQKKASRDSIKDRVQDLVFQVEMKFYKPLWSPFKA